MNSARSRRMLRAALIFVGLLVTAIIVAADLGIAKPVFAFVRSFPMSDKIIHFAFMGMLALLANLVLGCRPVGTRTRFLLRGTAIVAGLVLLEEVSQIWIPGRSFSLSDLTADGLGIFCGDVVARLINSRQARTVTMAAASEPVESENLLRGGRGGNNPG